MQIQEGGGSWADCEKGGVVINPINGLKKYVELGLNHPTYRG